MNPNVARLVLSACSVDPDRTVLVDTTHTLSRGDLLRLTQSRISALQAEGVKTGEFVVVLCGRQSSFWIDLLALWVIGARPVCLELSLIHI